jgi:hypothetical protein
VGATLHVGLSVIFVLSLASSPFTGGFSYPIFRGGLSLVLGSCIHRRFPMLLVLAFGCGRFSSLVFNIHKNVVGNTLLTVFL